MDTGNLSSREKNIMKKNELLGKQAENKPYTVMLIVLGIACIIFATTMTINNVLTINKEAGTLYIIGIVLVIGAYLWQKSDEKKIEQVNKAIDDDDGDSYEEVRFQ